MQNIVKRRQNSTIRYRKMYKGLFMRRYYVELVKCLPLIIHVDHSDRWGERCFGPTGCGKHCFC